MNTRAERQLIDECGAGDGGVIDGARPFFEKVLVRIAHADQIVQFLAVGVVEHDREAVGEPVGE